MVGKRFFLGHDLTGRKETNDLYKGTTLEVAEKLTIVPKGRLKHTCFVSGHDFSRAVKDQKEMGFSPCHRPSSLVAKSPNISRHGRHLVRRKLGPSHRRHRAAIFFRLHDAVGDGLGNAGIAAVAPQPLLVG